jgi:hypothetical protein
MKPLKGELQILQHIGGIQGGFLHEVDYFSILVVPKGPAGCAHHKAPCALLEEDRSWGARAEYEMTLKGRERGQ